ncbi:hypothetical protein NDU88_001369 [Pleurodeles waltl]|uniref:Uncharacterized protein n=1 Tax=Pleurodeles waltl TaxID=8319 RepID=A0AAV7NCE1_PLEWA|nr:hypothetical protein NDU88_001369 [Pleurodeles waltl]
MLRPRSRECGPALKKTRGPKNGGERTLAKRPQTRNAMSQSLLPRGEDMTEISRSDLLITVSRQLEGQVAVALRHEVADALSDVIGREDLYSIESAVLGLFQHKKAESPRNCYIDLLLLVTHRTIAMHWKANTLPG